VKKYLGDTNVLSELRKATRCDPQVAKWAEATAPETIFTSVLVLGEIRRGVERLRRKDPAQSKVLARWLEQVGRAFAGRVLPVSEEVADDWGRYDVPNVRPAVDGLLAATARVHGLTLVTRNAADFTAAQVDMLNPFSS
jgi:toxin FitB